MLLSALLMSAAVQAPPPAPPLAPPGRPAYWKIRSDCAILAATASVDEGKALTGLRYAVLRQVDGCPVPTPVGRPGSQQKAPPGANPAGLR
jgi:hypothetical protein